MNANHNIMKPHVRVIELLGGTGDGKTEIGTIPAEKRARKILIEGVGSTNSTLTERLMVFTTEYSDKMVVAVKQDENAFSRNLFTEIVSKAIAKVVKDFGKVVASVTGKDEEVLDEALRDQLTKRNNVKAFLSLLTDEQKEDFIKEIVDLYHRYDLHKYNYSIYNTVKNEMAEVEVKENSKKFMSAIQQEVERTMDLQSDTFKHDLWRIWESLNDNLSKVFFTYFDQEDISSDGYYCKDIMLDNPDTEFIKAMFTANNIQAGQRLSLEVLCSEIVIYVPMNRVFSKLIEDHPLTSKVFRDSNDNIVFATLDTRGLYHADNTDDENVDYCSELLYKGDIDAIAMVVPLEGDTNEKKIGELYRDVLKNFSKQIPVFMIHNKLDLFVASLQKQDFDDPLSTEAFDEKEFTEQDLCECIADRMMELNEDLNAAQVKAKKRMPIKSLACYLKRDASFPDAFVKDYNVLETYRTILEDMAKSLEESAYKIKFEPKEGEVPTPVVDEKRLAELIHVHVTDNSTDKKVFTPGMSDIALSLGKTPHGNAYNALRRRLKNGDGYTSNIDEAYFYNCKSFSVNFTANLRNFASPEFIHSVVFQALKVEGAKRTQEADEKYMKTVETYVNPKELVSLLLYYKAIQDAEREAFSFKSKFQNFLQNAMHYFNLTQIDEETYAAAVEQIVLEAAQKALDLNVTFR
ncbi:MAG: hypothetical protein MR409_05350 [Lachnospiraceae bacterium]|nr:hypothetical protein [Lachnospiraceae bacterium]